MPRSEPRPQTPASRFPRSPPIRTSGILLHPTSLPGPFAIGDLGPAARDFIDHLAHARQTWWQMLPLVPPGAGNSPYQSISAFAGNALLISPEDLHAEGLLSRRDLPAPLPSGSRVNFKKAAAIKQPLLNLAWHNFHARDSTTLAREFATFCRDNAPWLADFALFTVLEQIHGKPWQTWPKPLATRNESALREVRERHAADIAFVQFTQFLFFRQLRALKEYADQKGVQFIGDIPIFVACHSADVWSHPHLFKLDARRYPRVVAGVPPDMFSSTGQLWGNPLYDWAAMKRERYVWWRERLAAALEYNGKVRIDHFRGFAAAWESPANARDARGGKWEPGPKADFFRGIAPGMGLERLIAEDLGLITPDVIALRDRFHLPGMRVLQFAFDAPTSPHLPPNFPPNCVVYTGTHDNDTTASWFRHLSAAQKRNLLHFAPDAKLDAARAMLRLAWTSVADTAIAPMQDLLGLGGSARMNYPGRPAGNWAWRTPPIPPAKWHFLQELTVATNRFRDK
ncbi:MAG TPA: 4-alpha-glucanotransferase [Phycisphaerae bacterium]|nr:4-alpha-glucanotransferase [Phycisphaerae bacterium]